MKIMPCVIIGMFSLATCEAVWHKDWRLSVFFACSAAINYVVAW